MDCRDFPVITRPCPAPPTMRPSQRSQWCEHCRRCVHNLDVLSAGEQRELLTREANACVRYSRRLPAKLALGLLAASSSLLADEVAPEADDDEVEVLTAVFLGGVGLSRVEDMFEPSALPEPVDLLVPGLPTRRPVEQP